MSTRCKKRVCVCVCMCVCVCAWQVTKSKVTGSARPVRVWAACRCRLVNTFMSELLQEDFTAPPAAGSRFPLEPGSRLRPPRKPFLWIHQRNSCVLTIWNPPLNFCSPPPAVPPAYLDPGLGELGPLGQLLAGVDVGVVGPLEGPLQLLQLLRREGGATAPLLPLQRQVGLRLHVRALVGVTRCGRTKIRERAPFRTLESKRRLTAFAVVYHHLVLFPFTHTHTHTHTGTIRPVGSSSWSCGPTDLHSEGIFWASGLIPLDQIPRTPQGGQRWTNSHTKGSFGSRAAILWAGRVCMYVCVCVCVCVCVWRVVFVV